MTSPQSSHCVISLSFNSRSPHRDWLTVKLLATCAIYGEEDRATTVWTWRPSRLYCNKIGPAAVLDCLTSFPEFTCTSCFFDWLFIWALVCFIQSITWLYYRDVLWYENRVLFWGYKCIYIVYIFNVRIFRQITKYRWISKRWFSKVPTQTAGLVGDLVNDLEIDQHSTLELPECKVCSTGCRQKCRLLLKSNGTDNKERCR